MKRSLSLFAAVILLALGLVSCNKNTPQAVAKTFLSSLFQNDYETAKKFATKETINTLGLMEEMNPKLSDSAKKELMKVKVDIKSVKENGDKAAVTYVTSDNPKEQTLHMVKENGHWLAQWTKQDEMNGTDELDATDQTVKPDSSTPPAQAADTAQKK